jgi:hypothetical protein
MASKRKPGVEGLAAKRCSSKENAHDARPERPGKIRQMQSSKHCDACQAERNTEDTRGDQTFSSGRFTVLLRA